MLNNPMAKSLTRLRISPLVMLKHPTGRELSFDWSVNSFIKVVYEKIVVNTLRIFLSKG